MRYAIVFVSILGMAVVGLLSAGTAVADSVSIGIKTDSLKLGINIGQPPKLVAVPGTPVHYAPGLPSNYFFYGNRYYLFHGEAWYIASSYNGPWTVIVLQQVPPPILSVPVQYYRVPPGHWKERHGPPPWAAAKGHDKDKKYKDKKKKKGKGHDDD